MRSFRERRFSRMLLSLLIASLVVTFQPYVDIGDNAYAASGVETKIANIAKKYGSGTYFSTTGKACGPGQTNGYCTYCQLAFMDSAAAKACGNGDSCNAFAKYVFYNTFGLNPRNCSSVTTTDINSKAVIGDFIECFSSTGASDPGHFCIYMGSAGGNKFYAYEANVGTENKVGYKSLHDGGHDGYYLWAKYRIYHASNYNSINGNTKWWEGQTAANPGTDFYANLGVRYGAENAFKSMGVNANNNYNVGFVGGDNPTTEEEKVRSDAYKSRFWHYVRNSDGSYRISNCLYTNYYLTAEGTSIDSNVKVAEGYNSSNSRQKWFIYGKGSGEYVIRNAASDYVLWYNPSCNLQLRAKNDTNLANEKVMIYKFNPISGSTKLTVDASTTDKDTVFTWTKPTGDVAWYNIQIRRVDSSGNVLEYCDQMNMLADNTRTQFTLNVPLTSPGHYTAIAYPHSWVNYVASERLYFDVNAPVSCSHSNTELRGRIEPTCTADGYSGDLICLDCGKELSKGSASAATGHSWNSDFTIDKEATCTEDGSKSKHCANCGERSEEISIQATGHTFGSWSTIDTGSCDAGGARQHTCITCGFTETEALNPGGHDWNSDYTTDVAPTCTTNGSKSIHCSKCSATKDSQIIPSLGHDYGDWITDTDASCTTNGSRHKDCSRCEAKLTGTIQSPGHQWSSEYTIDKKATCQESGSKSYHCIVCDEVKPGSSIEITDGDHEFGNWHITQAPSCVKEGKQERECGLCGQTEIMDIAAQGHNWNSGTIEEKPTCNEEGIRKLKCQICGDEIDDFIPALDHKWDGNYTIDVPATCIQEGSKSIHCLRCDRIKSGSQKDIQKKSHNVSSWTIIKEPTSSAEGVKEGECLVCHNIIQESIPKTASTVTSETKKGTIVQVGGATVKVISASGKTVAFTKAPNRSSVTVPSTIKINGKKYKVTEVKSSAFTGKKIRTLIIGKNVKKIGKNAFKGSKVTTITVKTKLLKKATVKGSLKGSKVKTIKVKVGSKSMNKKFVKKYKKIFTKKNAGKKVTVK